MRCSKRRPWKLAAAVGLIVVVLAGLSGCGPETQRAAPAMTMEEACRPVYPPEFRGIARVRRALRTPIDVAFDKTPLTEALKVIGEKAGVAIIPDPDFYVDLSLRVMSLAVTGVPADELLDLILSADLAYVVEADRVLVTTRDAALQKMPRVFYAVADLVHSGDPDSAIAWQELVDIIKRNVNNLADRNVATWTEEGGPAAIDYYDGVFVVTQTPRGQERVMEFLTMLRKAKAQAGSCEPVRMPETAGAKHIRRRLAERVDVDFENATLLGVLDFLRKTLKLKEVNLVVDPDLDAMGLDLTCRVVTLKWKQAPIGEVLATVLGPDLGYRIRPHYVFISTRDRIFKELEIVLYPIRDIVKATAGDSPLGKPFGGGVGEDVLAVGWPEVELGRQGVADIIKRTVSSMTDPNVAAWTDEGGPAAMDYYDGVLIVTQTPEGHERIAELLTLLREGLARVDRQLQK